MGASFTRRHFPYFVFILSGRSRSIGESVMKKKQEKDVSDWIKAVVEIIWALIMTAYFILKDFFDLLTQPSGKSLKGKHVLVTGGARGLGREICLKLAQEGCRVTAVDVHNCEETVALAREAGAETAAWKACDITDKGSLRQLAQDLPPVDILINNAGIVSSASILEVTDEQIERMMQVNVMSHFWTIREFLPGMVQRGSGHVVAIASAAAFTAAANIVPYTATKYAVTGLMASLWEEMRSQHPQIKVTTVHPYFISPPPSSVEHWDKTSRLPDVTAEEVAKHTVQGIKRNKLTVTVPPYFYFLFYILHVLPTAASEMWRDIFPAKISSLNPTKLAKGGKDL